MDGDKLGEEGTGHTNVPSLRDEYSDEEDHQ
jgi:hypothetical protein